MRAKLNLLSTVLSTVALGLLGGAVVGCQTYDFESVDPIAIEQPTIEDVITARSLKPNMMMLVDTSGSMDFPTQCGSSSCPSRWTALQTAMAGFLEQNGTVARIGLTTYPGRERFFDGQVACGAAQGSELHVTLPAASVEDDAALAAQASQVSAVIQSITSGGGGIEKMQTGGGTPTNDSLRFLGALPELQGEERADFILLLTDGLPNCNLNNPQTGPSDACRCTQPSASDCAGVLAKLGCLDKDGSVGAIQELRNKQIKTIVIGFGAETEAGAGPETLNAMAEAGGFARTCPANEPNCKKFYQAGNQAELAQALKDIIDLVGTRDPCLLNMKAEQFPPFKLDAEGKPTTERNTDLMVVYVGGESLRPGPDTWELGAEGVRFNGATCERIKASTTANPVSIEVRVVRPQ